ncbi:MAG: hypothetical protein ACYS0G_09250 [Planctomycetota bacterium]|jgi:hypothetical protein
MVIRRSPARPAAGPIHRAAVKTVSLAAGAGVSLALGCGGPINEGIDLVGSESMPALTVASDTSGLSEAPSLRTLDRRHWSVVTIEVPLRQIEHHPTYVRDLRPTPGAYPSAVSALGERTDDPLTEMVDGTLGIGHAATLLILAPFDMVLGSRWPWLTERSPAEPYDRVHGVKIKPVWPWVSSEESATPVDAVEWLGPHNDDG